jgi:hypothetical protein
MVNSFLLFIVNSHKTDTLIIAELHSRDAEKLHVLQSADSICSLCMGGALALVTILTQDDIRNKIADVFIQCYCGKIRSKREEPSLFSDLEKKVRLRMTTVLLKTICEKTSGAVKFVPAILADKED